MAPPAHRGASGRAADPRRLRLPRADAPDNAITRARDAELGPRCSRRCPHTTIDASELRVGLPAGQMGNSEVGHLNIGAGRVVYQDFTRIDHAIATGEFAAQSGAARRRRRRASRRRGRCTCWASLSPGGVHSHERQIAAMVELAAAAARRASASTRFSTAATRRRRARARRSHSWTASARGIAGARIASICGRYYAMDRDQRWERVAPRVRPAGRRRAPFAAGVGRRRRSTPPTRAARPTSSCSRPRSSTPPARAATMADGDVVVFMNFRADRARQMTRALTDPAFDGFPRAPRAAARALRVPHELRRRVRATCRSRSRRSRSRTASANTSRSSGSTQLRIAETEKYAHVTYFFNGGVEAVYPGRGPHPGAVAEGRHLRPASRR